MKMRKILSILLALSLCASLLPLAVRANGADIDPDIDLGPGDDYFDNWCGHEMCDPGGTCMMPSVEKSSGFIPEPILTPAEILLQTRTPIGSGGSDGSGKWITYALKDGGTQHDLWNPDGSRGTWYFDEYGYLVGYQSASSGTQAQLRYQEGVFASGTVWDQSSRSALDMENLGNGLLRTIYRDLDGLHAPLTGVGFDPNTWHAGEEPVATPTRPGIIAGSDSHDVYTYANGDTKIVHYMVNPRGTITIYKDANGNELYREESREQEKTATLTPVTGALLVDATKVSGATNIIIDASAILGTSTDRGEGTTTVENEDGSTTTTTTYEDGSTTTTTTFDLAPPEVDTSTTTTYSDGAYSKHSYRNKGGSVYENRETYDANGTGTSYSYQSRTTGTTSVGYTAKESGKTVTQLGLSYNNTPIPERPDDIEGHLTFDKTTSQTFEAGKQYNFTISGGRLYIGGEEQTAIPEELLAALPEELLNRIALYNPAAAPTITINPGTVEKAPGTSVTIPSSTVGDIADQTDAGLTVSTPAGDVTIPSDSLADLAQQGDVTVSTQQNGDTIDVGVTAGGKSVNNLPSGITVTLSGRDGDTTVLQRTGDGTWEPVPSVPANDGKVLIPLSGSAKVELRDNSRPLADIPADHAWQSGGVQWAASQGIIDGNAPNFAPDSPLTTKQAGEMMLKALGVNVDTSASDGRITQSDYIQMLWRYAGSPGATEGGSSWQQEQDARNWANALDLGLDGSQPITLSQACAALQATAADSLVRDCDLAESITQYTKNNILLQAAQSMLAQANQPPQGILQLLQ